MGVPDDPQWEGEIWKVKPRKVYKVVTINVSKRFVKIFRK